MPRLTLHITGMSCAHCLHAINDALHSTPAVQVESVQIGRAVVRYDETTVNPTAIEHAIADAGYAATAA